MFAPCLLGRDGGLGALLSFPRSRLVPALPLLVHCDSAPASTDGNTSCELPGRELMPRQPLLAAYETLPVSHVASVVPVASATADFTPNVPVTLPRLILPRRE